MLSQQSEGAMSHVAQKEGGEQELAGDSDVQLRSVLPHEPGPNREAAASGVKGYILLQGSFLPKPKSCLRKEKGSESGKNRKKKQINSSINGAEELFWVTKLQLAAERYFKFKSTEENSDNKEENNIDNKEHVWAENDCEKVNVESSSRIKLQFVSFHVAKEVFMYWKQRPIFPRDVWSPYLKDDSTVDTSDLSFGAKPIQITHVTTIPLPPDGQCWAYVSPPKFRRLLYTPPNKTSPDDNNPSHVASGDDKITPANEAESMRQSRGTTRFLYISGLGRAIKKLCLFLEENGTSSDDDFTHLEHVVAIDAIRDLIKRAFQSDIFVEVWIPNWNKKKMKAEQHVTQRRTEEQDDSGMKSVDHCYVGLQSHDIANQLLRILLEQDNTELQFEIPSWCFIERQQSNPVYLKAHIGERLFIDWADVTPRLFSSSKNKKRGEKEIDDNRRGKITGEPSRPECTSLTEDVVIHGLVVLEDFVSKEEEQILLATLRGPYAPWAPKQKTPTGLGDKRVEDGLPDASSIGIAGLKRRVQHYGYVFDYQTADVLRNRDEADRFADCPPLPAVPEDAADSKDRLQQFADRAAKNLHGWDLLGAIVERCRQTRFDTTTEQHGDSTIFSDLNQLTINEYAPGSGIGSHIDTVSAFGDGLMSISLGSGIVMEFKERRESKNPSSDLTGKRKLVYLPQRSLILFSGDARYKWEHMIVSRRTDTVNGKVISRKLRLSLTLRTALSLDGNSAIPRCEQLYGNRQPEGWYRLSKNKHSDSIKENSSQQIESGAREKDPLQTPETERAHVHEVYDAIAVQWNHTRGKRNVLWPKATEFLESFAEGTVLADVGCGDGKYFPVAKRTGSIFIGTDISIPLLQTSHVDNQRRKGLETDVLGADCMNLPFASNSFDGVICIAVMHHLSTSERRGRCIDEIGRILKKNGRAMVQAWALEQNEGSKRNFSSTDVFVPFNAQPRFLKKVDMSPTAEEPCEKGTDNVAAMYSAAYEGADFDDEKGLVVFQRYCHVYREKELDEIFQESKYPWRIEESGYEAGNYYVIARSIS